MIRLALLLVFVMAAATARGGEVVFESKSTRTHLLELFTSEGCSSCPPAEAWLNNLKNEPRLWQDFVPVVFHVDYWDHLGWRDPFASKTWTERQADYSARWKSESVYTPAFVLDGVIWHNTALPSVATETPGVLKIAIDGDRVVAAFKPASNAGRHYEIHLARLGFGLGGDVTAGENSGRTIDPRFRRAGVDERRNESRPEGIAASGRFLEAGRQFAERVRGVGDPGGSDPSRSKPVGGWLQ